MSRIAAFLALLLTSPVFGQKVDLPSEIKGVPGQWIIVAPKSIDGGVPKWRIDPGLSEVDLAALLGPDLAKNLKGKVVTCPNPKGGRFKVESWNAKGDVASDISTCWVVIGDQPGPQPPIPDPPIPDPKPPAPIPGEGFRVFFYYPDKASLTKEQISALGSTKVRQWMNAHCVKGPDGKTAEWRQWENSVENDLVNESKIWQDAYKKASANKKPWILVSTGTSGEESVMPANEDELMKLLVKWGGS